MKFQFLGTAAAEGIPALYCQCDTCKEAAKKGGKNIRSRSQALLDDTILIDFGPDTYYHMLTFKVPLDTIHHVLITHDHSDHFYETELCFRRKGYASKVESEPFYVYGTQPVYNKTIKVIEDENMPEYLQAVLIKPFEAFKILDYEITPLKANHAPSAGPVNYLIKHEGKTILYAHDTGYFEKETWEYLSKLSKPIDFVSLDCTAGLLKGWNYYHLSFDCLLEVVNEMKQKNIITDKTHIVANHFSHNGHANYEQMKEEAAKHGIDVSYDGMVVTI